jgi:hypothetical protein
MNFILFDTAPCICWIGGDPHYRTFDGVPYDNQGACKYMTAEYANNDVSDHNNFHETVSYLLSSSSTNLVCKTDRAFAFFRIYANLLPSTRTSIEEEARLGSL